MVSNHGLPSSIPLIEHETGLDSPPTSSVETPDPTAGAPGNQRDSIAEENEGGTEKSVEPSFRQACHCESEAQRALKPGPTRMRDNDNQTLHGGPEECDEKFTKSKDRNDEDVDESDSEYQDQDEEDTEDGEDEDEDEDDGPRSRKRPRQSSEDSDGFRNHSHGETSSKIRVSHERRSISTSSSAGPGGTKQSLIEADYEEWPMEGFLKRTRVGHELFYSLDFRLNDIGTTVSATGPSRSPRKPINIQNNRNGRNSPVVLIPSKPPRTGLSARKARSRFTVRENKRLIHLKEVSGLSWQEISCHFPGRTMGTLQVHYCTKLKRLQGARRGVS
jgi:hypothetical protein